jgi:hypothetical protein
MTTETYQVQLERLQATIAKIEAGAQDLTHDGRRVVYPDLKVLYARERELRVLAAREARGGGIRVIYGVSCP